MTAITATMNQWEPSQDSPEVIVNENFKTLQWSSVYGCNPDTTAGLTWGYYGGEWADFTITASTLTLTTATTNYIVVLRSTGVISTSTSITNWNNTALYARVYLVTTGASTVSTVVDHRTRTNGIFYYAGSFTGGTLTSALNEAPIVTIASSTTPAIFAAAGNTISMTGTTTVTGFDTIAAGAVRRVVFTGALQLTHNATSMINLTGANITTAAGDIATFLSLGSGNTRMVGYERADGTALVGSGSGATELKGLTFTSDTASQADSDPGAGLFRWNNATQSSATQLFIDNSTADAVSVSTFWASLGSAGFIYMQQGDDSTKWQLWKWTATPTNGTGYYKFTVTLQASGGSIANTKTVYMTFDGAASAGGGSTQGKQSIYMPAGGMYPSRTNGCSTLSAVQISSGQPDLLTLDFDPTTQEYAQFSIAMPKKWNEGTVTFKAYWSHPATTTNFGVVWDLQAVAISDDDAIGTAFGTAQTSTDTGGTTNDLYVSPESSAITVAGTPAAEDMVFFRLSRVTGNGSDTMAVDARLHGILLYITTDADTDA